MDPIDVPEVYALPDLGDGVQDHIALGSLALTCLLSHKSALLYAEWVHPEATVTWFIRSRSEDDTHQRNIPVVVSQSRSLFRATLAAFGHHYMKGQLYGGFARVRLRQAGRIHSSTIYMSNTGQSDFWIRVYASADSQTQIS